MRSISIGLQNIAFFPLFKDLLNPRIKVLFYSSILVCKYAKFVPPRHRLDIGRRGCPLLTLLFTRMNLLNNWWRANIDLTLCRLITCFKKVKNSLPLKAFPLATLKSLSIRKHGMTTAQAASCLGFTEKTYNTTLYHHKVLLHIHLLFIPINWFSFEKHCFCTAGRSQQQKYKRFMLCQLFYRTFPFAAIFCNDFLGTAAELTNKLCEMSNINIDLQNIPFFQSSGIYPAQE